MPFVFLHIRLLTADVHFHLFERASRFSNYFFDFAGSYRFVPLCVLYLEI